MSLGLSLASGLTGALYSLPGVKFLSNNDRDDFKIALDNFEKGRYGADAANSTESVRDLLKNKIDPYIHPRGGASPEKGELKEFLYVINRSLPDMYKTVGKYPFKLGLKEMISYLETTKTEIKTLL